MSRTPAGETVVIQAENNIYTVLVILATLIEVAGLIMLFLRGSAVLGPGGLLG